jgi:NAD(P)-dependent dehydrogenase (short-subunit alcohol dehydrogenase family)
MPTLDGQIALVSGGAGDIGRAIVRELAQRGADVALCDVVEADASALAALLADVRRLGRRARYDRVDVADALAVRRWVEEVEMAWDVPTLVVPNAAIVTLKTLCDLAPDEWARELQINLNGAFHLAQAGALRLLHHGQAGRIVFVGSWAAHAPHSALPAYCVAKAGLRMLCRCLALELAPRGILVNEVAPGYVDAGLSGRIFEADPAQRAKAIQTVPIHALIAPEEVAQQVAFLCEPGNRHMTGSVVLMDGGLSLITPGSAL